MARKTDRQIWDEHYATYWGEQVKRLQHLVDDAEWEGLDCSSLRIDLQKAQHNENLMIRRLTL